jgi:hypothetical protein
MVQENDFILGIINILTSKYFIKIISIKKESKNFVANVFVKSNFIF